MNFLDLCRHTKYINNQFPFAVTIDTQQLCNIIVIQYWLDDLFGKDGWILKGPNIFGFRTEQDKLLFVLKWG